MTMKKTRTVWLALAVVLILISQVKPHSQTQPAQAPVQAPAGDYVLQRGDDLEVKAFDIPELNTQVRIRPDGKISLLLLNDIEAAGRTASQLNQVLTEGYAQHFRTPRLTVIVKSFTAQNVFVGGEVMQPSALALPGNMTALQALVRAGGLKGNATGENVLILRDADKGTPRVETLNIREVLENQKPDAVLQPSDVVYVPKNTQNVYVGGEVARPGMIELTGDTTILAAIFQAGGFLQSAKTDGVVLVRNDGKDNAVKTEVKLNDVFLSDSNTQLKPFDLVFVPKSKIARLDQWVDQHIRQLNPLSMSFGFSYIFGNKGAVTQTAIPVIF
jgi:protein involved in polysaccharide export with SLBB domain